MVSRVSTCQKPSWTYLLWKVPSTDSQTAAQASAACYSLTARAWGT